MLKRPRRSWKVRVMAVLLAKHSTANEGAPPRRRAEPSQPRAHAGGSSARSSSCDTATRQPGQAGRRAGERAGRGCGPECETPVGGTAHRPILNPSGFHGTIRCMHACMRETCSQTQSAKSVEWVALAARTRSGLRRPIARLTSEMATPPPRASSAQARYLLQKHRYVDSISEA